MARVIKEDGKEYVLKIPPDPLLFVSTIQDCIGGRFGFVRLNSDFSIIILEAHQDGSIWEMNIGVNEKASKILKDSWDVVMPVAGTAIFLDEEDHDDLRGIVV